MSWSSPAPNGRVRCELCPRYCTLSEGQRGFCFVRQAEGGDVVLTTYGRASGFCIDPIEKKPLNHFLPGSSVLSFGTAGCNLGCKFCQNHDISKAREMDRLMDVATPDAIAKAAVDAGCASVAFTYNDPVIFAEYAIDTAAACRARGIHTVAVTAGYITERARGDFFSAIDAANVDLKAFDEEFYRKLTYSELEPVKETLTYLCTKTDVWVEITTLLIEGFNDSDEELTRLSEWVGTTLGDEVPLHFTAFHPDFKMRDVPRTSLSTLRRARSIAQRVGLKHVYTGNAHDHEGQSTYCAGCGELLIGRDWYAIDRYAVELKNGTGHCPTCQRVLRGCFTAEPGTWGANRRRVAILAD
ncbi:MAG: AmmeMemoRadiSam system radical SAM enzyme [Sandaracinaceae bacterium]